MRGGVQRGAVEDVRPDAEAAGGDVRAAQRGAAREGVAAEDLVFTVNGEEVTPALRAGRYYVQTGNISAVEFGTPVAFQILDKDGNVLYNSEYSVFSYVNSALNKEGMNEDLLNLLKAMVLYNQGLGVEVNAVDPDFPVDNIGYFVSPLCDNQSLNVNYCGPSRFIFSGSANIDAAKKYLEYMASDESLAYMTENVGKWT